MILNNKLFQKYNKMSAPVKASIWFAVCNFLQKGINMISIPIFTRLLTTEQYGVFTIYQSWYTVICVFATLNLHTGVFYNGMVKFADDKESFTSSLNGLSITATSVLFVIYLIFHDFFNKLFDLPTLLIIAMFVELLFAPAFSLWSVRQRFDYKYKMMVGITIITSILSPVISVIAVLFSKYKAEARVLSFVGVQVCVGILFAVVNFYKGKKFYIGSYWKYALCFNIPLLLHYFSISVLGQADRIMISKMIGLSEAAIYGLGYSISQMLLIITSAIFASFTPYTYTAINNKRYTDITKNTNAILLMLACMLIIIVCFGPEVIRIFASKDYYAARWIVPPVVLSVFFNFLFSIFVNVELYFEANKFVVIVSGLSAVINIILNYIFIPVFGYVAAGYTTLFCYLIYCFGHYVFHIIVLNKKASGVRIYDIKFIVILSLLLMIFSLGIVFVYDMWLIRYMIIVLVSVVVLINRKYFLYKLKIIK